MENASPLTATEILAREQEAKFIYNEKQQNLSYNYGIGKLYEAFAYKLLDQAFGTPITKENKVEKYKLNQTEKACVALMQNNGETLGTMTLAILEGNDYLTSSNSIDYYTNIQSVRNAIQKYIGGEDD